MNELTQKWVDALRSGKYTQGKKFLRSADNHYCCLGVLCEVAGFEAELAPGYKAYRYNDNAGLCSIPSSSIILEPEEEQSRLMRFNDQDGKSFAEIADYIEKRGIEASQKMTA